MNIQTNETLINALKAEVNAVYDVAAHIQHIDDDILLKHPHSGAWSVSQIVEHLNTYNRYYIPRIEQVLSAAKSSDKVMTFRSGWLGAYFIKAMYSDVKTRDEVANKMKAAKGHVPDAHLDVKAVVAEFLSTEKRLLALLDAVGNKCISDAKIPITLSKFIKINAGDALRFLIAHQTRHLFQLKRTLSEVSVVEDSRVLS